jgi:hypothetical protein
LAGRPTGLGATPASVASTAATGATFNTKPIAVWPSFALIASDELLMRQVDASPKCARCHGQVAVQWLSERLAGRHSRRFRQQKRSLTAGLTAGPLTCADVGSVFRATGKIAG